MGTRKVLGNIKINMNWNRKKSIPRREDPEYREIENFEDFELINNVFYEMGIRSKRFKELAKKFAYCDSLSEHISKIIESEDPFKNIGYRDCTNKDEDIFTLIKKSPKENFEEALKRLENNGIDEKELELLNLDFETFQKEIDNSSLERYLHIIPKVIEKDCYIDFYSYFDNDKDNTKIQKDIEYEESGSTSQYIKREYKKDYYLETKIDSDNNKITRTFYPTLKRKLLIEHVPRFSSNHLILHNQARQLLENFFEGIEIKIKKQRALADAFFCYDYYTYRQEEVANENQLRRNENLENTFLQDAIANISLINNADLITDTQKKKQRASYEEVIEQEELNLLDEPTLNKTSEFYIFKESQFKKSGINDSTALKYYQWIKPYIDGEYIKQINIEPIL